MMSDLSDLSDLDREPRVVGLSKPKPKPWPPHHGVRPRVIIILAG